MLDLPENATLERTDAVVRELEHVLAAQPEVINYVSTVGRSGPIDFNGMVRHYYLRNSQHQAEIRINLVGKKSRELQSHGIGLRLRDQLGAIAKASNAKLQIVELPPGPPVLASLVAEVYGREDYSYADLMKSASTVALRMQKEPGIAEVDDIREVPATKFVFIPDQEKAAISGVAVGEIARTIETALHGDQALILRVEGERNPLRMTFRLPRSLRSSTEALSQLSLKNSQGELVSLHELGTWHEKQSGQTIYHKNLRRVAYVFAECVGRPPQNVSSTSWPIKLQCNKIL